MHSTSSSRSFQEKESRSLVDTMIDIFPKAELHLHIEGTFEPELMFSIAQRNRIALPYNSIDEVRKAYHFSDLQAFLDIYYRAMSVLQTEQDFYDLTSTYLQKAHKDAVRHAEIFFDPQAHTSRGVKFETFIKGIHRALADSENDLGITSRLIMCFLRDMSAESAMETLNEALSYTDYISVVGLDSKELGNPPRKFEAVYQKARESGLLAVAHSGEEAPATYIWDALNYLHISRVDHGYHCLEDPSLLRKLSQEQIPLTLCPLASVGVNYFSSMDRFSIRTMLDHGLLLMINSDDPAYFGGYVSENYRALQRTFSLSESEILRLLKNSFLASFLDQNAKSKHLRELDDKFSQAKKN